jgi:hypothetical protein
MESWWRNSEGTNSSMRRVVEVDRSEEEVPCTLRDEGIMVV